MFGPLLRGSRCGGGWEERGTHRGARHLQEWREEIVSRLGQLQGERESGESSFGVQLGQLEQLLRELSSLRSEE